MLWLQEMPLVLVTQSLCLTSLGYNHPFMPLGCVGIQSWLQAPMTCGLAPTRLLLMSAVWESSEAADLQSSVQLSPMLISHLRQPKSSNSS